MDDDESIDGVPERGDEPRRSRASHRIVAVLRISAYLVVVVAALFAGGFGVFATHVSELTTPRNVPKADAIIVLTGGQARIDAALDLLQGRQGQAAPDQRRQPGGRPRRAAGGDRRRPQAVLLLRRHRPRRARHDRQCRRERQMGAEPRIWQCHPGHQQLPHAAQPPGSGPPGRQCGTQALSGRQLAG